MAINKSAKVSVVITDDKRKIIWVNDQFSLMTGYTLSELRGKKPSILQGRNTEQSAVDRIRKCLEKEIPFHDRVTNYRKNGEEYTCALTIHPIFNTKGLLSNFIAFEVDNNLADPNKIEIMQVYDEKRESGLTKSDELDIYFRLHDFFRSKKPYLNPDLSLFDVAVYLNTNTKYLSQVINNQTKNNFRYFVNKFRVQHFQYIISTSDLTRFTLFSLGQTCGFKNKSTFHSVIQNHTGKTPKEIATQYED